MAAQTILIAEDDPDIRDGVRILLAGEGYHILEAENGTRALEIFNPEVDLVILDIMMPGMSGLRVCEELRKVSTVPILFLTAKSQESDKLLGLTAGGDDYLAKPFSHGELLMKVDSLIRRYRVYKGKVTGKQLKSDVVLDEENRRILRGGEALELTETEFSILQFLVDHRGSVVSVAQIYEGVWHEKYGKRSGDDQAGSSAGDRDWHPHCSGIKGKRLSDPCNRRDGDWKYHHQQCSGSRFSGDSG